MKNISILLFVFVSISVVSQTVTNCKDDLQLLSYQDSLNRWEGHEKFKADAIRRLDRCRTFGEYMKCADSLGFSGDFSKQATFTEKGKRATDIENNKEQKYELLIRSTFGNGNLVKKLYVRVVRKPTNIVIFKAYSPKNPIKKEVKKEQVHIDYLTLKLDGSRVLDSTKIFVKTTSK